MNHQVAITDLTQKAEVSEELLKELTAKKSRRGLFQKREHQVYEHRRWLLRWTRRGPKWCENPKSSSKWKKQEWKAPANTGPFSEIQGCPENIFTRAPIKRNRLPNVQRLSCRNCQKTQRAEEDLQRGQKKQHSCIPFSLSEPDKLFRGRLWPVDKKNDH